MNKIVNEYNHSIEVDEENRRIAIYRVFPSGEKQLYTHVDLPEGIYPDNKNDFMEFARMLGENILIDSPAVRKLLALD